MKNETNKELLGKIGITESDINPTGTILVDGEIYEAISESGHIGKGRGVKITRIQGKKIIIHRV